MKDLIGQAAQDYWKNKKTEPLFTETTFSEKEELDITHWFRTEKQLSNIERKAIELSKDKILDVGCGVGSLSLILQEKQKEVTAIDISSLAVEIAQQRGVINARKINLLELKNQTFDTILLLMNGTGIFQTLKQIDTYLSHLKSLLAPNGQILIDSSDIIYLFEEDEDGGRWMPAGINYYGEVDITVYYQNETEKFPWLYLDFNTLRNACAFHKLHCELVLEGEHYDYLARITHE